MAGLPAKLKDISFFEKKKVDCKGIGCLES